MMEMSLKSMMADIKRQKCMIIGSCFVVIVYIWLQKMETQYKQYDGDIYRNSVRYAGNGVYAISYKEYCCNDYIRFIDAETG